MAYPTGVVTRPVSFGPAVILEDGTALDMKVTIKSSTSMVWLATGSPLVNQGRTDITADQVEKTIALPVTDQDGYGDGLGNTIDVSDGKQTNYYTASIEYQQAGKRIMTVPVPAFVLPVGDGSTVDLDKLVPVDTTSGITVLSPIGGGGGDVSDATTAAAGIVELATTAEGVTGTDATRAMTPAAAAAAIGANVNTTAYVDFTTKADGAAPTVMDTGQSVHTGFATGRAPVISGGRLVADPLLGTSGSADYFQADVGASIYRLNTEFTLASGSNDGTGTVTMGAWSATYLGTAPQATVPQARCHFGVVPGTGATGSWSYSVFAGGGAAIVSVKSGSFVNPAQDGVTPWVLDASFDLDTGIAYCYLPDGQLVTVSDAEISAAMTAASQTPIALRDLAGTVGFIEHFAVSGSGGKFPQFKSFAVDTVQPKKSRSWFSARAIGKILTTLKNNVSPAITRTKYSPTTLATIAASTTNTSVDTTNVKVTAAFGPTGCVLIEVDCYYEFTRGADTVYGRLVTGTPPSALETMTVGASGQKLPIHHTFEITGGTPGVVRTWTYAHSSLAGNPDLKYGGSGSGLVPPIVLKATPF